MNALCNLVDCTLTDEELMKQVDEQTDTMYKTGKLPDRQVPARPDADYDLLVGELLLRFKKLTDVQKIEKDDKE